MGLNKNEKNTAEESQKATAFVNWTIQFPGGTEYKAGKGFPIFQNPKYPNADEDLLVAMAKAEGGAVELTFKVRVNVNNRGDKLDASAALALLKGVTAKPVVPETAIVN